MGTSYYFAYGSNMHFGRVIERLSNARLLEAAILSEHTIRFHKRGRDGSGKCNVVSDPKRHVAGAIYQLETLALARLDRIEGGGYRRLPVVVRGMRSGRRYRAYAYMAKAVAIEESLIAYEWYRDIVVAGAVAIGLPTAYVESLSSFPAQRDPNARRQRQNAAVLGRAGAAVATLAGGNS
ncbi:MAG: gamma-glutamylcyclotransferase family protein [Gammaproteobacteria bacterium]